MVEELGLHPTNVVIDIACEETRKEVGTWGHNYYHMGAENQTYAPHHLIKHENVMLLVTVAVQ